MKKLNFSGHETFPLRQLWPYKSKEMINTSQNPFSKSKDESMKNWGVGLNMLKSMSFWIQSCGLYENKKGDYILTEFGDFIFKSDPFLENIQTIWLLHIKIVSNLEKNTTLYWIFNINNNDIFSFEDFQIGIYSFSKKLNIESNTNFTESSLKKDFNVYLNMYLPKLDNEHIEDKVQNPFWNLKLIKKAHGLKMNYQLISRSIPDLSKNIFYFSLLEYINLKKIENSVTFEQLLTDECSPGRILKLTEYSLRHYLDDIEKNPNFNFKFDDTAGQRQLFIKNKISGNDFLKKINYE